MSDSLASSKNPIDSGIKAVFGSGRANIRQEGDWGFYVELEPYYCQIKANLEGGRVI